MASARNPHRFEEVTTLDEGFDDNTIVKKPANDVICPACKNVPRHPMRLPCGHIMCQCCELKWWRHHERTCPLCRRVYLISKPLTNSSQSPILAAYKEYEVKCDFGGVQCGFVGNPYEVEEHQTDCVNVPWICMDCRKRFHEKDFAIHDAWCKWEKGASVCSMLIYSISLNIIT